MLISQSRLDQLLESEIVHCSLQKPTLLTLQKILAIRDWNGITRLLGEELPVRHAVRIKLIESIPGWERQKNLRHVRKIYADSFKKVRLLYSAGGPDAHEKIDPEDFMDTIINMKKRYITC